jgi:hypothetical protein
MALDAHLRVELDRHLLDILDPPLPRPRAPWWAGWVSVPISRRLTGSALVELNYDVEIPPWWVTYPNDVPK